MSNLAEAIENLQQQLANLGSEEDTHSVFVECQKLASFAWMLDALRFYRKFGFFSDLAHLSGGKAVARLISRYRSQHDELTASLREALLDENVDEELKENYRRALNSTVWHGQFSQGADLELLKLDKSKVWFQDLECDVCEENYCYFHLLSEMASIMGEAPKLQQITEQWDIVDRKPKVTFEFNGVRRIFHPRVCDDWLDLNSCLTNVNEAIAESGWEFLELETEGQCGCFAYLRSTHKDEFLSRGPVKTPTYYVWNLEEGFRDE